MANVKISALSALGTTPAGTDVIPITDVSGTPTTKKVTVTNLMGASPVQSVAGRTGAVTIANTDVSGLGTASTLAVGTSANNVVQLDGSSKLPAVDGSALTNLPTNEFKSIVAETGTARTLSDSDAGKVINCSNGATITITVPSGLTSGFNCTLVQSGAGTVQVEAGAGATVAAPASGSGNTTATKAQYSAIQIIPVAANSYFVDGDSKVPAFLNQYGVALDGTDDYVELGTISAFNSVTNFSWSAWFKSSTADRTIFGGTQHFYRPLNGGGIFARVNNNSASIGSANYNDGTFRHIAFTYSSGTGTVYINGASIGSSSSFGSTTNSNAGNSFKIGRYSVANYLNGNVDEVGVWSSTLSAAEVTEIYASGTVIDLSTDVGNYASSSNLQHWWRCGDNDGGSGTTLTDAAGSLNGTLENGASFTTTIP